MTQTASRLRTNVFTRSSKAFAGALLLALIVGAGTARAQQPPIRIGIIFSYTVSPNIGRALDDAFAAFVKQHGDTVAGRKIELIRRDDGGIAPDIARRLAQELIVGEHVDMLAGITFTPNAIAVGQVSTQAKKPLFIINAATSGILEKNPYTARFGFTTAQITVPLARWAAHNGFKTAFALFQDYGPGIDAGNAFETTFTAEGGKMVGELRVPLTNNDFAAYIQRIRDARPDAVFIFLNPSGGGPEFLKEFKNAGLPNTKILGTGDVVDENNLAADGDAAIGLITSFDYSAAHPSALNRDFVRTFASIDATVSPDFNAVAGYDVLAAIYKVVAAQNGNLDPDKTMELVKGMRFESPRGPIAIDPDTRDIVQNVYIRRTEKRNGKLVNVEFATIPMVRDPNEH